jgi:uncharacterized protein (TIGR02598 family)
LRAFNRRRQGGFSLIEVALAVGVLSFGMLATVGLLPVGMSTFHQAIDTSIGSQIVQHVINDARQSDFTALLTSTTSQPTPAYVLQPVRYFDYQGNELTSSANSVYEVNTRISPQPTLPNSLSLGTLVSVTVQIASNPGHQTIPYDPGLTDLWNDPAFNISTYSAMVAQDR